MNRRNILKLGGVCLTGLLTSQSSLLQAHNKKPKNVLVLGGTGYLGPVIVQELIDKGHKVTLFNRGITNQHLFPNVARIKGDRELEGKKGLFELINSTQKWDWVIDTWQKSPKAVLDSAEILKSKVNHYQYVSTVSVYDDWHQINITEDVALNPVPPMPSTIAVEHRYAIRKTLSEIALRSVMGDDCSVFRSHGLRGETKRVEESKSEPYWQVKIARCGKMIVPAEAEFYQTTDIISLARFIVHCGEQQHLGAFNVAYSPFKFRKFVEDIKKLLKTDTEFHWLPQKFLKDNNVEIYRTNRAGRYRFNVDRAIQYGLVNRPLDELTIDQLKGYKARHPNDDFVFGTPGTHSISKETELQLIKKWQESTSI